MPELRVFIVDDHPVMRQGIEALLVGDGMRVVGKAATVAEALAGLAQTRPQVVLVDLGLGAESGFALLEALATQSGGPRRLVYSMNEDAASVERSFAAGAHGYVTKGEVWEALAEALRAVVAGQRYLSPRASRALEAALPVNGAPVELSVREREVFDLLGEGFSTSEVGERLGLSPRTIESYCARLLCKLEVTGMRELRRRAITARRL